ncbi:hepatic sodium/bile acid cotransporter-like [Brachyhypopomus gauderio]|uniref:hepatic sodium/bile acid cotransporter-like n=1 Tax=Brachyhypopomus gauderio TaxID=698409 RepID=UPI0040421FBD
MTTFSTLLALGTMPLLLYVYSQGFSGVAVAIPYAGIATALAMTTLPCAAGVCIRHYAPQHARLFSRVGMSVALLTLIILGILVGVTVGEAIRTVTTPQLLITAALMPLLGYILGYVLSSLFKLNQLVVMTTFSTLLALGTMPLLLYVYNQGFSGVAVAIPYAGIATALAMTTLPCAAGVCIRHYAPQHARLFSRVGMSVALLTLIILGILVGVTVGEAVWTVTTPQLLITAALMPLLGYILGYVLLSLFKLNQP